MRRSLRGFWNDAPTYVRLTYLVGIALMVTGLVYAVLWAVIGGSSSGPLSWRKPMTFGISFGVTTLTLGWVALYLPIRRAVGWTAAGLLCASTVAEVAWVSGQHARGVPSHFNTATAFDAALFGLGGVAVAVTILVTIAMTVAMFVRTTAAPPLAWAIRAGLVALLGAQAIGVWMIANGTSLMDSGGGPLTRSMSTYGAAGAMKFTHAIPMHAIQVLAVLAWVLSFTSHGTRRQLWLVVMATAGYAGLFGAVLLRTASGLAPFDYASVSMVVYATCGALLASSAVAAVDGLYRRVPATKD